MSRVIVITGASEGIGGRGMEMQSAEQVVQVIEEVIDKPVPDSYTNPASDRLVQRYFGDIPGFEDEIAARINK